MQAISAEDIFGAVLLGFVYVFKAIIYILYGIYFIIYYFLRGFRYLFIVASGTGYDLTKKFCTDTNEYLQSSYVKENAVKTISYYDYCVESKTVTLNVVVMAIIMILIMVICNVIIMEAINYIIGVETKYNNNIMERNNIYMREYHNLVTIKQYVVLSKYKQNTIMSFVVFILHIVMSCTSYIVRYYNDMNDYWNPILLGSYFGIMLILNVCSIFILIALTPIVERVRTSEISILNSIIIENSK